MGESHQDKRILLVSQICGWQRGHGVYFCMPTRKVRLDPLSRQDRRQPTPDHASTARFFDRNRGEFRRELISGEGWKGQFEQ